MSAPKPWTVKGNRIYAADGEEIGVATKASPRHRKAAEATAALMAAAPDLREALAWALSHVRYDGPAAYAEVWAKRYNDCIRLRDAYTEGPQEEPVVCDRCAEGPTPDNPIKRSPHTGLPRHANGCSAVHGPNVGRG